jgi:hypothetical protein
MSSLRQQPKNSKMITEHAFRSFTKIADFVSQLKDVVCVNDSTYHEVALYNHLLTKTKLSHKQAIQRHIELFSEFCTRNQDALINKDSRRIVYRKIIYSEKVFIDLYDILNNPSTDGETVSAIWNHLLVIQATIDPTSEARAILQNLKQSSSSEGQFLDGFLSKIEGSIDKEKMQGDPLSAATSILQSGVLNDLVGSIDQGVKSGNLDLGKLVGTVQQMLGGLTSQGGGGGSGGGLDIGSLMGMMGGMMGGMGGGLGIEKGTGMLSGLNADKLKEQIDKQVEAELVKEKAETLVSVSSDTGDSRGDSSSSNSSSAGSFL